MNFLLAQLLEIMPPDNAKVCSSTQQTNKLKKEKKKAEKRFRGDEVCDLNTRIHKAGFSEKDNFGLELFLPKIFFCSSLIRFSCSFFIFCRSSSIFLCSSTIRRRSSA